MVDKDMIQKKIQNSYLHIIILLTIILHSLSCNYFTEPEPFVNKNLTAEQKETLGLLNYQSGDTVTGSIIVELQPKVPLSEINYVTVLNDSTTFPKISQPPFKFDVDTRWWLNGKHELSVGLYKKNYNIGLLGVINEPSIRYSITLTFRHQPFVPDVYGERSIHYYSNIHYEDVNIRWHQNMIGDVRYYIVQILESASVVFSDTIHSALTNKYIKRIYDSALSFRFGAGNEFGVTYTDWQNFH